MNPVVSNYDAEIWAPMERATTKAKEILLIN